MAKDFHNKMQHRKQFVLLVLLMLFAVPQAHACPKEKPFKRLSRPEKVWTVFHPFKAKEVYECAKRSRAVTDSLEKAGALTDNNGGQLDAFRHAYWMALLVNNGMKEKTVRKVGERHEKGNYLDFRKGKLEDGTRADSMMCVMDLRNNASGIAIAKKYRDGDKKISLIETILNEIWNGNLAIMRKNESGGYLDANGKLIDLTLYGGKWYIPKVIVKSDMIDVAH